MKNKTCSLVVSLGLPLILLLPFAASAENVNRLEVFSWWTSGGEAAALNALFQIYKERDPGVEIINAAVSGGGGSAARPILQTRLSGGNPPDTWQVHPGWELFGQYVDASYCEPLNDIYQSENWLKVLPSKLTAMVTKDDKQWCVLTGVHRGNDLWYNKKVLDKAGIKIGDTINMDEFLADCEKLKAAGITPLALGDSGIWTTAEIFENTLAGVVGPAGWEALFSGKMAFDDPKVKNAAQIYAKLLQYQNSDHSALSWDQGVKAMIEGRCAFAPIGDWAHGEFVKANLKDNIDIGWVSYPGTNGIFIVVADGFTLAKNAPHRAATIAWLKSIGSKESQEAFNSVKGSIPARLDVDKSKFGPYHQWAMQSFASEALLPTCVHGAAAPAGFQQTLNDAITTFVVDKNADRLVKALAQAAKDADIPK